MNKSVEKAKQLTYKDKLEYLSKYLNRYVDNCIERITSNKDRVIKIIENDTIIGLIVYLIDNERNRQEKILRDLEAPFEVNIFCHFSNRKEVQTILYDLIIKEDRS